MVGSFICSDTSRLEEFGFVCCERNDKSRFYYWNANHIYDGHCDIIVNEYKDKKTGWYEFYKLNKLSILPKIVQLANAGLFNNYEL